MQTLERRTSEMPGDMEKTEHKLSDNAYNALRNRNS